MDRSSPLTTGAVARLLLSTEPRVAETVRRGRINPEPVIAAGRRLWTRDQVLQAAEALGILDADCRARIDEAFGNHPATTPCEPGGPPAAFLGQQALCRLLHGSTWIDIGGHDSAGWACRKAAELAHRESCGPTCLPLCGGASELVGMAGITAVVNGDLITPRQGNLALSDVLSLVTFGIGSSCGIIVVDDLGALLAQRPTPAWWRDFAEAADASTADGVSVVLLAATKDLGDWPEGLPQPAKVVQGEGWWLGSHFGTACEVAQ